MNNQNLRIITTEKGYSIVAPQEGCFITTEKGYSIVDAHQAINETEIQLTLDDECFLTDRIFHGWHGDAEEGETYMSEWACHAKDPLGNQYKIVWRFPATKGDEPNADEWPWDDIKYIHSVERL